MAAHIDCDALIDEVRQRPLLWDTADENYKDKTKKCAAWSAIASTLTTGYNDQNEAQRRIIRKHFPFHSLAFFTNIIQHFNIVHINNVLFNSNIYDDLSSERNILFRHLELYRFE